MDNIKAHFGKYWKQYILGLLVIFAFYKAGQYKGWFRKKGGSDEDKVNAEYVSVPIYSELDYNKQITVGDSDAYSRALVEYIASTVNFTAGLSSWITEADNPDGMFTYNLRDYIAYILPDYNAAHPSAPMYVVNTISLNSALKLSRFMAGN